MKLGQTTDSQDADGKMMEERPVPDLTREQIDQALRKYTGDFFQTPPMVSALKREGVPLYKLAREGKVVEREPRRVHISRYQVIKWETPLLQFEIDCSKGFYVRTYCHDIGEDLGCGAHLIQLSRLKSGNFSLDRAISWKALQECNEAKLLLPSILSLPEISRLRRQ
jgi:tRNA pseudouridine55 synthase